MKLPFSQKIRALSEIFPVSLYCVGGYVRNYILSGTVSKDVDLAAPLKSDEAVRYIKTAGFTVVAEYKRTGTVVFKEDGQKYEYTSFRKDEYTGGGHSPESTAFTDDISADAKRRDFKCNAVYYDIKSQTFVDPLGGIADIKNRVLDTVIAPEIVFSHDGLRLMRLARFAGELNFIPTEKVISGAKKYAKNINDVSKERVFEELKQILICDCKYPFSDPHGHYTALKILDETRVLDEILPELTAGREMEQRKDFHKYDVLEHSLKTVFYADKKIRLYALLHDVGKPSVMKETGRFYGHDKRGGEIVREIAERLKFDNAAKKEAIFLALSHMKDLDLNMKESKVRLFIVENIAYFNDLMLLKQADFSAGKDDLSVSPTVIKWRNIYEKMKTEKIPFTVKELNITAADLLSLGFPEKTLGTERKSLLEKVIKGEATNEKENLTRIAVRDLGVL